MEHNEPPVERALGVVVALDGSDRSKQALVWAARYALDAGLPLTALVGWHYPTDYGFVSPMPEGYDPEADARSAVEHEIAEVLGDRGSLDLGVIVAQGDAGRAIVDASASASLVVLARRDHGEVVGWLLGSVSQYVVTHAHCPVVVVRDGTATAASPAANAAAGE